MKLTTLCYIEKDGCYLMLYRNKKENDLNEGKWVGVGGKFLPGETPDECLLREVYEETGFTLLEYRFRGFIRFSSDIWGEEFMCLYSGYKYSGDLTDCDEGEFSWIKKEEAYNLPIWEGDKAIFRALETCREFFTMEVIYKGDELVNNPVPVVSPLGEMFKLQDKGYRDFQGKLVPGISPDTMIGIRVPALRKFAKDYKKSEGAEAFMEKLPHYFYDENLLHGILISEEKDYKRAEESLDKFLPFVDNWAVCDIIAPKSFKKNKEKLIGKISEWVDSKEPYTVRFGLEMLMTHFLDSDFKEEYLKIPARVDIDHYYVKMMVAWFFATALAKQWDATFPYIKSRRLEPWTHNKTIQKAKESFRITPEQKEMLAQLYIFTSK